ncbi:MAG: signal peptidase I [Candidatus Baltobacteraceae bacterium]
MPANFALSPLQLLLLICVFAVARIALGLRPAAAGATGTSATAVAREYLDAFIVAGLLALFLITFVVRTFYIPSGSMEPTLQIHDVLLVNEFQYRFAKPNRGEIVVFKPPVESPDDFIKRVIATPGDRLRIQNGTVFVNGLATIEPYIAQKPDYDLEVKNYGIYVDGVALDPQSADVPPRSMWQAPDRIPAGFYFMMGDNRNDSEDSHIWGFAQFSGRFIAGPLAQTSQKAEFTGRAFLLFWPLDRLRSLH